MYKPGVLYLVVGNKFTGVLTFLSVDKQDSRRLIFADDLGLKVMVNLSYIEVIRELESGRTMTSETLTSEKDPF